MTASVETSRAESPAPVPASPAAMSTETLEPSPVAAALDREALGQIVRRVWVSTAMLHDAPKPSWLVPWEGLGEWDKEVDRRIGETVAAHTAAVVSLEMHRLAVKEIRAAEAERDRVRAKLAEIAEMCRNVPYRPDRAHVLAGRILAITGTEGEAGHA